MEGMHYGRSGKGGRVPWSEVAEAREVGSTEVDIRVTVGGKFRISCGFGLLVQDRLPKVFTIISGCGMREPAGSS